MRGARPWPTLPLLLLLLPARRATSSAEEEGAVHLRMASRALARSARHPCPRSFLECGEGPVSG
jgi:hypothetical protein